MRAACLLVLAILLLPLAGREGSATPRRPFVAPQKPTFAVRVEAVRVDVLVTGNGRPVPGLTAGDFEVRDNGVAQEIQLASFEELPVSVLLALDRSDSVAGERLAGLIEAGQAVLSGLRQADAKRPSDRAALMTFNDRLRLDVRFTERVDTVRAAMGRVVGIGATALFDAAYASLVVGASETGRTLVILFTDGDDTCSWLPSEEVIQAAKRADLVLYGVTVGSAEPAFVGRGGRQRAPSEKPTQRFLSKVTEATGGRVFKADSDRDLKAMFLAILEEFQQRYLLSYAPKGVSRSGWHAIDVRVKGRRVKVDARPGYLVGE